MAVKCRHRWKRWDGYLPETVVLWVVWSLELSIRNDKKRGLFEKRKETTKSIVGKKECRFLLHSFCHFYSGCDMYPSWCPPFGEQCILHWYVPSVLSFFTELMDKIKHGGSLFYSWNVGLGQIHLSVCLLSGRNFKLAAAVMSAKSCDRIYDLALWSWKFLVGTVFGYYLKEHFEKSYCGQYFYDSLYALCGFSAAYAWWDI